MKKHPNSNIKIYNHVAKYRVYHGFSQVVLAERIGVTKSTLFRIEQGQIILF